jgi:hypothetical protein
MALRPPRHSRTNIRGAFGVRLLHLDFLVQPIDLSLKRLVLGDPGGESCDQYAHRCRVPPKVWRKTQGSDFYISIFFKFRYRKDVEGSGVGCWLFIVDRETLRGQRTILPLALAPSRGEFDLDLGAEGAGDFFERR